MNIPRATIFPTVTFNTATPDGMAAAEAWVRELVGETEVDLDGWKQDAAAHLATPEWVIADRIMHEADRICELSPRPMKWSNLDANVRMLIGSLACQALADAGYVIGRIAEPTTTDAS